VNISQTVGIPENSLAGNDFSIYPNPSNEAATLAYRLASPASVGLEVFDVLGKCVYQVSPGNQPEGDYALSLSKREQKLGNGVYFVKLLVNGKPQTKKLIISE
jgi:hypothetical protein